MGRKGFLWGLFRPGGEAADRAGRSLDLAPPPKPEYLTYSGDIVIQSAFPHSIQSIANTKQYEASRRLGNSDSQYEASTWHLVSKLLRRRLGNSDSQYEASRRLGNSDSQYQSFYVDGLETVTASMKLLRRRLGNSDSQYEASTLKAWNQWHLVSKLLRRRLGNSDSQYEASRRLGNSDSQYQSFYVDGWKQWQPV